MSHIFVYKYDIILLHRWVNWNKHWSFINMWPPQTNNMYKKEIDGVQDKANC